MDYWKHLVLQWYSCYVQLLVVHYWNGWNSSPQHDDVALERSSSTSLECDKEGDYVHTQST